MKDKSDSIRPKVEVGYASGFILRAIRKFDVLASSAREVVFANVNPSIGDVVNVRENRLIEDNLVTLASVLDGIDRAFTGCTDGGDANINSIDAIVGTLRKRPLTRTVRGGCARLYITHATVLSAACVDLCPTTRRRFGKLQRTIVNDETANGSGRISHLFARGIDLRAVIGKRWIRYPQ